MGTPKKVVYLANNWGFAPTTANGPLKDMVKVLEDAGFAVLEPFARNQDADNPRATCEKDLDDIRASDYVVAVLNGEPPDVGVAVEVGYAAALGKHIFLFRDDFRICGDTSTFPVNLMFMAGQEQTHPVIYSQPTLLAKTMQRHVRENA